MKSEMKKSLRGKLLGLTLVSFMLVTVVVAVVGVMTIHHSMTKQVYREMRSIVSLVESRYDEAYPGAFGVQLFDDGTYDIYKGREVITKNYGIIDQIQDCFDYEVTLFCKNIRVQTTLRDNEGRRFLTTKAPTLVTAEVVDGGKEAFYKDVTIGEEKHFAYYKPIVLDDGTIYGMIGVSCSAAAVRHGVLIAVLPLVSTCIFLAVVVSLLSVRYITGITNRIGALQKFMNAVASGNFNADIPASTLQREDELGALAQDGKKMQRAIRVLVEYDALTELHNRRYGDKRLKQIFSKAQNNQRDVCVCICDIDFFKKVNDTYGHEAGDEVLRQVAKVLKKNMAGNGFVARWGGEEFLLVFEHHSLEKAVAVLEKMLDEIRAMHIIYGEHDIQVTMSMGIVQSNQQGKEDDLLKQADDLLYYAKTHGRNQIQKG